jgi:hypothetical protein
MSLCRSTGPCPSISILTRLRLSVRLDGCDGLLSLVSIPRPSSPVRWTMREVLASCKPPTGKPASKCSHSGSGQPLEAVTSDSAPTHHNLTLAQPARPTGRIILVGSDLGYPGLLTRTAHHALTQLAEQMSSESSGVAFKTPARAQSSLFRPVTFGRSGRASPTLALLFPEHETGRPTDRTLALIRLWPKTDWSRLRASDRIQAVSAGAAALVVTLAWLAPRPCPLSLPLTFSAPTDTVDGVHVGSGLLFSCCTVQLSMYALNSIFFLLLFSPPMFYPS